MLLGVHSFSQTAISIATANRIMRRSLKWPFPFAAASLIRIQVINYVLSTYDFMFSILQAEGSAYAAFALPRCAPVAGDVAKIVSAHAKLPTMGLRRAFTGHRRGSCVTQQGTALNQTPFVAHCLDGSSLVICFLTGNDQQGQLRVELTGSRSRR
jgi:hypothetical protein